MSISNYSELNTAVANWLSRSDLTSRIPEGIALCEAKMNRYLRAKAQETKDAAFAIASEYVNLPSNFGEVKSFHINGNPTQRLELMGDAMMVETYQGVSGKPKNYNIVGSQFRFGPPPDASYTATLVYILKVPALTGSATTNWMITNNPDCYLYGVNAEMCGLMDDEAGEAKWNERFYRVMGEIQYETAKARWGGGSVAARPG